MSITNGFCGSVRNSPLIEIPSLSKLTGCRILGKAEFPNPGGSVKDRAALEIVLDAISSGKLKPRQTIVEGTAGNTGINLTHMANALGQKTVIVIRNTQSQEKIDYLGATGADLRPVPTVPYSNLEDFNHVAHRLAEEKTTDPEIWQQTETRIDAFVTAVGSRRHLASVSRFLKKERGSIHTVCVAPFGAAMFSWFKKGHLEDVVGGSITEGNGQIRLTANLENAPVDNAIRIPDAPISEMVHYLTYHE